MGVMKNVRLMPIKFLNEKGSGTLEGAIKSIDYANKMNVHVMSNPGRRFLSGASRSH